MRQRLEENRATIAQLESDPKGGSGKKELLERAQGYETIRDQTERRIPYLEYAQALFQIAIVLGSLAIVAMSRPIFLGALGLGALAALLMINGFHVWIALPLGG